MSLQTGEHRTSIEQTARGGYFAVCSCGYRSVNKRTETLAVGSAVHHRQLVARELRANGVDVPTFRRLFVNEARAELREKLPAPSPGVEAPRAG